MANSSFYTGNLGAASNRADLRFTVELFDQNTSDTVDFTLPGTLITVALRRPPQDTDPTLVGTNLDGHVIVEGDFPSRFTVHFTRAEMTQFIAGELDMGITVIMLGDTYQLFSGQLPVIDGVVAA